MDNTTITAIGGAVVLGLTALGGVIIKVLNAKGVLKTKDRIEVGVEWQQLFDRMQADIQRGTDRNSAQDREMDILRERQHLCELRQERASAHIEILEEALRRNNIPFRPFDPDPLPRAEPRPHEEGGKPR